LLAKISKSTECVRREASSIGDLNQAITPREWTTTNQAGYKQDIIELGTELECALANSF